MKDLYKKQINRQIEEDFRFKLPELTEEQLKDIDLNLEKLRWVDISCNYKLTNEFIRKYKDSIMWHILPYSQILSEDLIEEFLYIFNIHTICLTQDLSKEFIAKHYDYIVKNQGIDALLMNRLTSKEIKDYIRMFI